MLEGKAATAHLEGHGKQSQRCSRLSRPWGEYCYWRPLPSLLTADSTMLLNLQTVLGTSLPLQCNGPSVARKSIPSGFFGRETQPVDDMRLGKLRTAFANAVGTNSIRKSVDATFVDAAANGTDIDPMTEVFTRRASLLRRTWYSNRRTCGRCYGPSCCPMSMKVGGARTMWGATYSS